MQTSNADLGECSPSRSHSWSRLLVAYKEGTENNNTVKHNHTADHAITENIAIHSGAARLEILLPPQSQLYPDASKCNILFGSISTSCCTFLIMYIDYIINVNYNIISNYYIEYGIYYNTGVFAVRHIMHLHNTFVQDTSMVTSAREKGTMTTILLLAGASINLTHSMRARRKGVNVRDRRGPASPTGDRGCILHPLEASRDRLHISTIKSYDLYQ